MLDVRSPVAFALWFLAALADGRKIIPVDPSAPWSAIGDTVARVGGRAVILTERGETVADPGFLVVPVGEGTGLPLRQFLNQSAPTDPVAPSGSGSVLLFTSGSTGEPKGVELAESQLMTVAHEIAAHNRLTARDRGYCPLPLFHVNAEVVGLLSTLVAGAAVVLDRGFHRTDFWDRMSSARVTWINAVPAILAVLARTAPIRPPRGLRFIRTASAPLPEPIRRAFDGTALVVSWGMTEAASQITATSLSAAAPVGSVGLPVSASVQVRDDAGRPAPPGTTGRLWIRGPGIVTSYFRGAAADRFDADGWLDTGDVGRVDSEGFVFLVGRSDDVINRGGEKIYPREIEDALLEDPRVAEAVVVSRADPVLGHVPVAFVELAGGSEFLTAQLREDLTAWCRSRLPRSRWPVEIIAMASVPRAPTGKVRRNQVRQLADLSGK